MNAITLREAEQNLAGLITRVLADAEPTMVVSDTGEQVVVVPLAEYRAWQETIYLLSNPANAAHLRESLAEAQAGRVHPQEMSALCD